MDLQRAIDIDYGQCFYSLKKNWKKMIAALVLGMIIGAAGAFFLADHDDQYIAVSSVYSMADGSYDNSAAGISAVRTYSYIIKSHKIAEEAAKLIHNGSLTGEDIYNMISTEEQVIQGTTYVYENQNSVAVIYAKYKEEEIAAEVANAVAEAFAEEVNKLFSSEVVQVLDHAGGGERIYSASVTYLMYIGAGGAAAAILYIVYLIASVIFSGKVVTVRDASLYGQLEVISAVPLFCEKSVSSRRGFAASRTLERKRRFGKEGERIWTRVKKSV